MTDKTVTPVVRTVYAPLKSLVEDRQGAAAVLPEFVPLELETRLMVDTATAARHLNRKPQTLRGWHCNGTFPAVLRPTAVMGRLAWPVSGLRAVLGVA